VDHRGILYFATDGHPGLGGLDVFAVQLEDLAGGIVNLGMPVNSAKDDFAYIINDKGMGYFSSDRSGGEGDDDIYSLVEKNPPAFICTSTLLGQTVNAETGDPISYVQVQLFDADGALVAETQSDVAGDFLIEEVCKAQKLMLIGTKEDFEDYTAAVENENQSPLREVAVPMVPIKKVAEVGTDLAKLLELNPIYFDLNKADIRPDAELELQKILDYMNEFPKIRITIGSHTDSRGSDRSNLSLSDSRAKMTKAYLVSKGIDAARVLAKGYGETKLVNRCANGVDCEDEEHEMNRRSEFIVME